MAKGRLAAGLTPRLLSKDAAAAYCGVSPTHFEAHVKVEPIAWGRRTLWDKPALDHWLDQLSGLAHAVDIDNRSIAERLNGRDEDTRR